MPGAVSNYLENALLNHVFRGVAYTSPTAIYVALYTSDPTDADIGTEVSGGGYARQQVTFNAPSDGVITNTADIVFPEATADWGTITHLGLRDAATAGNLLWYGPVVQSRLILTGDQLVIKAGTISVSLD